LGAQHSKPRAANGLPDKPRKLLNQQEAQHFELRVTSAFGAIEGAKLMKFEGSNRKCEGRSKRRASLDGYASLAQSTFVAKYI
jgi:hypothetical protein